MVRKSLEGKTIEPGHRHPTTENKSSIQRQMRTYFELGTDKAAKGEG